MKLRDAALATLPEEVAERIAGLVEEMYERVVGGELSAAEAEEQVAELSRKVGREVLSAGWRERYGQQTGRRRSCDCGGEQRFEGYRERWVVTVLGPVRYRRAYYRCGECGVSYYAGEAGSGLERSFSLPAQEAVSLVCCELPFERGCQLLGRLSGVEVSMSHARRLSQAHGGLVEEALSQEREALFAGELEYLGQEGPERLYVGLDGTQAPFVDDWHEAKLGAVYEAEPDEEGMDQPRGTTYATGVQEGPEAFGQRLYQEAARRGVEQAGETVVIGDGWGQRDHRNSDRGATLPYIVRRRQEARGDAEAADIFAAVFVGGPKGEALVRGVSRLPLPDDAPPGTIALAIETSQGTDMVVSMIQPAPLTLTTWGGQVTTDARIAVVLQANDEPSAACLIAGALLEAGEVRMTLPTAALSGSIVDAGSDAGSSWFVVDAKLPTDATLVGSVLFAGDGAASRGYPIRAVEEVGGPTRVLTKLDGTGFEAGPAATWQIPTTAAWEK